MPGKTHLVSTGSALNGIWLLRNASNQLIAAG
jgi:hypothetical protein